MDSSEAQFGGYPTFPEVLVTPGVDAWMCSTDLYGYDNVVPSALSATDHGFATDRGFAADYGFATDHGIVTDHGFAADHGFATDHGFANPVPPDPQLPDPSQLQNPELLGLYFVDGEQVANSGFEDPAFAGADISSLDFNVTFTDVDFSYLSQPFEDPTYFAHHSIGWNQEYQPSLPALDSSPPFLVGGGPLWDVPSVSQDDADQCGKPPIAADNLKNETPHDTKCTLALGDLVRPYLVDHGNGRGSCTWKDKKGDECGAESGIHLVKRHIRVVHLRIL